MNDNLLGLILNTFAGPFLGLIAFLTTLLAFPVYISWLNKKQITQFIREEGPSAHVAKQRTPTMGGLCFIITILLVYIVANFIMPAIFSMEAILALMVGIACGLVGLTDDMQKVANKANKGISASARLKLEFILGLTLATVIWFFGNKPITLCLLPHYSLPLNEISTAIYLLIIVPFLVTAATNAVNLHDGLDGLAGGTAFQVFVTLAIMLFVIGNYSFGSMAGIAAGALAAFLIFNKYPASIFMGDTGSLFIGGLMAAIIASSGLLLWFIPLALIYIIETLSVIAQVTYFKLTKEYKPEKPMSNFKLILTKLTKRLPGDGKRLFRMAPFHHHYEAIAAEKNISESKVVLGFWLAQFIICVIVLLFFFMGYLWLIANRSPVS